jgi:O-antigen ligase
MRVFLRLFDQIVLVTTVFPVIIFSLASSLVGFGTSNDFIGFQSYFMVMFVALVLFIFGNINNLVTNDFKVLSLVSLFLAFPLMWQFFYSALEGHPFFYKTSFIYIISTIPAFYVSYIFSRKYRFSENVNTYCYPFFTLSIALTLYLTYNFYTLGFVKSYILSGQQLSYFFSFACGITLFMLHINNLLNKKILTQNVFLYGLLILFALLLFYFRGRGAFVVLVVYLLFYYKESFPSLKKSLVIIPILLISYMALNGEFFDLALSGSERIFGFIYNWIDNGFDLSVGTSKRDIVYLRAFDQISENYITGLGPFSSWTIGNHPHNLFLDVLLQYGIFLGGIIVVALLFFPLLILLKLRGVTKSFFILLILFPIVQLQFSSGYLKSQLLFFALGFGLSNYFSKRKVL